MTRVTLYSERKTVPQCLAYWEERRGAREMPARADIDPLEIKSILPQVFLLDVFHEPRDFAYRLIGTRIVWHSENDYTGRRLRSLPTQGPSSRLWSLLCSVVEDRKPIAATIPYLQIENKTFEVLATPLSDDGESVNMILGAIDIGPKVAKRPPQSEDDLSFAF